jgi:hypothetical protein
MVSLALKQLPNWEVLYAFEGKVNLATGTEVNSLLDTTDYINGPFIVYIHGDTEQRAIEVHNGLWLMLDGDEEGANITDYGKSPQYNWALFIKDIINEEPIASFDKEVVAYLDKFVPLCSTLAFIDGDGEIGVVNFNEGYEYKGLWVSTRMYTPEFVEKKISDTPTQPQRTHQSTDTPPIKADNIAYETAHYVALFDPMECDLCKIEVDVLVKTTDGDLICSDCAGINVEAASLSFEGI